MQSVSHGHRYGLYVPVRRIGASRAGLSPRWSQTQKISTANKFRRDFALQPPSYKLNDVTRHHSCLNANLKNENHDRRYERSN